MAKSKTKLMLFSASSEQRKGFTMPTIKKIKSVLMSRSKTFLVNLVMTMFSTMTKSAKIKVLVKIEKGTVARKAKKRTKSKTAKRKSATKRKTGSTYKKPKSSNGRKGKKGKGFQGKVRGSKAEKTALAKAKRARKK